MKIRGSHVAAAVVLLLVGLGVVAVLRAGPESDTADPEAFLREVEQLEARTPASEGVGSTPPVDADRSLVADIEVGTTALDVGTIPNDAPYHASLEVANRGRATLEVNDIKTTCACTQGVIPDAARSIAPGETVELEVVVLPNRIPGFYSKKRITIYSNDPDDPTVDVDVIARIEAEFELIPGELELGAFAKGTEPEKTIVLRQLQDGPCEVKGVGFYPIAEPKKRNAPEDLAFEVRRRPETQWQRPGKVEYEINVRALPIMPPGEFKRRVFIRTALPRLPAVPYAVTGEVRAPYVVEPTYPQAVVLAGAAEETPSGEVLVRAEKPVRLKSIVVSNPAVVARAVDGQSAAAARLQVAVADGAPAGAIQAEVRFEVCVDGACAPERVKVRGFVRAPAAGS